MAHILLTVCETGNGKDSLAAKEIRGDRDGEKAKNFTKYRGMFQRILWHFFFFSLGNGAQVAKYNCIREVLQRCHGKFTSSSL